MTRADVLLSGVLALLTYGYSRRPVTQVGTYAEVYAGATRIARLDLAENGTHTVKGRLGELDITIKDGRARVAQATCRDKRCVRMGWLSHSGEAALCVPNRVMLKVVSAQEGTPDAVVG